MFHKALLSICVCSLLASCAQKRPVANADSPDFVALTLGGAAEKAHSDLSMLAKLRGSGVQPLLPPPDPALGHPVNISWTGPAAGALKEICLAVGYRYREIGTSSAQPLAVVVHGTGRSAYDLLEDIAWQIQPQASVRVDPVGRFITLARSNGRN